jgi:hypothetical protein
MNNTEIQKRKEILSLWNYQQIAVDNIPQSVQQQSKAIKLTIVNLLPAKSR